jgi:hypothetical protein
MTAELPASDLSRAQSSDPDQAWPALVEIRMTWLVEGRRVTRTIAIQGNEFFGTGRYGAPMTGDAIIARIERLRRDGAAAPLATKGRK